MKLTKKKVFVVALAVCMIAILSMGTLAWFTAQDEVTNNFYIADSDDTNPDDIFSIAVKEETDSEKATETADGYDYKDILPGDLLAKNVTVENTGYYDQYVRVTITISDASLWKELLGSEGNPSLKDIVDGVKDIWKPAYNRIDPATNEQIITLYYNGILSAGEELTVFTAVKIPTNMTVAQAAEFEHEFSITVKAEAVQTEHLGTDAESAFAALENGD